ncbi:MAG: hypothetical protein ABII02_03155 [Candidatus Magasanikbacteria bacterium]
MEKKRRHIHEESKKERKSVVESDVDFFEDLEQSGKLETYIKNVLQDPEFHEQKIMTLALFLRKKIMDEGLHGYTIYFDQIVERWDLEQQKKGLETEFPYDIFS